MNEVDQKERAENYCSVNSFVSIVEVTPSGRTRYYNGIILKVHEHFFMFKDHILPHPFPVSFSSIKGDIKPSNVVALEVQNE